MKGYYVYESGPPLVLKCVVGGFAFNGPDNCFFDATQYTITNGLVDGATVSTTGWQFGPNNPDASVDGNGLPVAKNAGQGTATVTTAQAAGDKKLILADDGSSLLSLIGLVVPRDITGVAGTKSAIELTIYTAASFDKSVPGQITVNLNSALRGSVAKGAVIGVIGGFGGRISTPSTAMSAGSGALQSPTSGPGLST